MTTEKYNIGGTMIEPEAFEAFADIPQNRVLLAEKLTANPPVKPEIIEGPATIEEVFEHFNPAMDVEFETERGAVCRETLAFKNLGDFGLKGITAQSSLLSGLTLKKDQYQKIIRQLLMPATIKNAHGVKNIYLKFSTKKRVYILQYKTCKKAIFLGASVL